MDALTAATESAPAISNVTSFFMIDPKTFATGAEHGFSGLDFYVTGRGGVLGEVDADVVAAAFVFFSPDTVRAQWEAGRAVLPALDAGRAFAGCLVDWTHEHVPADLDAARLAELAERVVAAASPAGAPLFAGWRANVEAPDEPAARATFALNALRELRAARHAGAVLAAGLDVRDAVSHRSPGMAGIFGWGDPVDTAAIASRWDEAEAATDVAFAPVFEVLDDAERAELTDLSLALLDAVR